MALERLVGGARPNGVWSSEVSDNLNGVQRDSNNLKIIVGHPLYIDLGSVDRGNYFPELRRPCESNRIIGRRVCFQNASSWTAMLSTQIPSRLRHDESLARA